MICLGLWHFSPLPDAQMYHARCIGLYTRNALIFLGLRVLFCLFYQIVMVRLWYTFPQNAKNQGPARIRKPLILLGFNVSKWRDSNPRPFGPEDLCILDIMCIYETSVRAQRTVARTLCFWGAAAARFDLLQWFPRAPFLARGEIAAQVWEHVTSL